MIQNNQLVFIFNQPIFPMLLLSIQRKTKQSVFNQLVNQIVELIETGSVPEAYQMPSTRHLSIQLGVNRSTIVKVYEELWALGYLESSQGSYTKVRKRKSVSLNARKNRADYVDKRFDLKGKHLPKPETLKSYSDLIFTEDDGCINLQKLEPDPRLVDKKQMSACFRDLMGNENLNLFGYNHPLGYGPLRKAILAHMKMHSINAGEDNILITNGSQNSLQLIFQAFISPEDTIAISSPTYGMIIPLLKHYGPKVVEIPVMDTGIDLLALNRVLEKQKVKFLYNMPTFQNPTGTTMPQDKREQLLNLCEKYGVIIIEDSIEEEMKFFGKVHLPIKSMDQHDMVIYLGSFSKILAPGFRTGWIIAGKECIRQLSALKTISDISSNTLTQALLHQFCKRGYYELHIRKMLRIFRKRMKIALKALKMHIPSNAATWIEPLGGFLIWVEILFPVKTETDLEQHFLKFGVRITAGNSFFYSEQDRCFIRISISKCNEMEIEEGIQRLAKAIEAFKPSGGKDVLAL